MNGSIRRRSKGSWELCIDRGRDAQGRRIRKFVNVRGKRADADKRLRELLQAVDRGLPINLEKATVGEWMESWLTQKAPPNARQKTFERYRSIVRNHVSPKLGQVPLIKLTPAAIQELEANLSASGMAPAGVELVHRVISAACKYAVKMDVLWRNPAQAVTPPKVEQKEIKPPEIPGVKRILELAEQDGEPFFPAMHLTAFTGMRRGEVLGLRWSDVDLEKGALSVVQTLGRSLDQGLIFEGPKSKGGRRAIDLDSRTIAVLRAHRVRQLEHRLKAGGAFEDQGLVFCDALGNPLNPMALTRAFQRHAKRVGLTKVRLHDLRHFHASVMFQQGESPVLVSKRLGHSSVSITMDVYSHLLSGWQREAAEKFAQAMEKG